VIFTNTWWNARRSLWHQRWHYRHRHAWGYWWAWTTWDAADNWVDNDWDEAWEYDYDDNVVIDEETVFINDEPVAAVDDYIGMGVELADVEEPAETDAFEWLSLGVFAMSTSEDEKDPQMMLQLVLAKDGRVGGTYYHFRTQSARLVQGSLDEETQRIAFTIGDSDNVVEAGLESLTQDEAPLWVHFEGGNRTQTWYLIRLETPPAAKAEMEKAENENAEE
jgi:hypothetical protein